LEKQPEDGIVSAIGNATLVVCSIGASEKEIFDVTGPYRIDYMATNKLVEAGMVGNLYVSSETHNNNACLFALIVTIFQQLLQRSSTATSSW
jgi:hypothetical protein